jgi:hypothetical protein
MAGEGRSGGDDGWVSATISYKCPLSLKLFMATAEDFSVFFAAMFLGSYHHQNAFIFNSLSYVKFLLNQHDAHRHRQHGRSWANHDRIFFLLG